jgi:hypothetical protein
MGSVENMTLSYTDTLKDSDGEDHGEEYIHEMKIRQDLENLDVEDVLGVFLETIDKDMTMDRMESNLITAIQALQVYKTERIKRVLWLKDSWDFKKDQERRQKNKESVEAGVIKHD